MEKINTGTPGMTPAVRKALAAARTQANRTGTADSASTSTSGSGDGGRSAGAAKPATKPARGRRSSKPAPASAPQTGANARPTKGDGRAPATPSKAESGRSRSAERGKSRAATPPARPPSPNRNDRVRLRPGELRQMVADHLAANPKVEFSPTQLSNVLRRSSGAIANALVTLCEQGLAVQTTPAPRTYRAAPAKSSRRGRIT